MSGAGRLLRVSQQRRGPQEPSEGQGPWAAELLSLQRRLSAPLTSKKAFSSTVLGAPMVGVPGVMDSTSARSMTPLHSVSIRLS